MNTIEKSSPLVKAMNMFVYYGDNVWYHYAIILPPEIREQTCRARLAQSLGWTNPQGVSSWEFILPKVLDKDVKVHLMEAVGGGYHNSQDLREGCIDNLHFHKERNCDMFKKDIKVFNDSKVVTFVLRQLNYFVYAIGSTERENKYNPERWDRMFKRTLVTE